MSTFAYYVRHVAGAVVCRIRYGRNCPHIPGIGTWREW